MLYIIFIIFFIAILIFLFWGVSNLFSVWGGVQYISSNFKDLETVLKITGLNKNKTYYELGSGLGNGLIIANRVFGAKAIGIEISPFCYLVSRIRTFKNKNVEVNFGSFYNFDLSKADIVYCYLFPAVMEKLYPKFKKDLRPGAIVITRSFLISQIKFSARYVFNKSVFYIYKF